ncbi:hypothetical protein MIMGU_mgv1a017200mg [Erythranthe guttata]|uniref:Uncharacterized protein n=1 Tax=Erythranthe guttata TaxID=4155 RepID=A0A022RDU2_ERYGU|nr:hypothetical protein MIMGU_mgv1a017200mg [Erythranthe guttata]
MELIKASVIATLLVLLLLPGPGFSRGRSLHVKKMGSSDIIYEIDYRGPETHTYLPPPNRAGGRPGVHHKTTTAARHKSQPINGKKIVG